MNLPLSQSSSTLYYEKRHLIGYMFVFIKGICMGIADIIPGVSGGTVAFIVGIYRELIESIKSFHWGLMHDLRRGRWQALIRKTNGLFLMCLFGGIGFSVVLLSGMIDWLMKFYEVELWAFFLGLIVISAFVMLRKIAWWRGPCVLAMGVGLGLGYLLTSFEIFQMPSGYVYTFFAGLIAICAMMLPGISGSFLLLMMGKYEEVIHAVASLLAPLRVLLAGRYAELIRAIGDLQWLYLMVFGMGILLGMVLFSRVISWIFRRMKVLMIAFLSGLMLGSAHRLWPWQLPSGGLIEEKVNPWTYRIHHGIEGFDIEGFSFTSHPLSAGLWFFLGMALVLGINFFLRKRGGYS